MDFLFLSQTALFRGCSPRETADMLQCLRAERRVYEKDRVICHAGDTVETLGLVLSGGVNIESVDVWGSRRASSVSAKTNLSCCASPEHGLQRPQKESTIIEAKKGVAP